MAKMSAIEKNNNRKKLVKAYASKRKKLKDIIKNRDLSFEERFEAQLKIGQLPRNSSQIKVRNRCEITGRPRGYNRKFRLSRIALRDLAAVGQLPGIMKYSW